jgi:hypothetical protein
MTAPDDRRWMVCRPRVGDVMLTWDELTDAEMAEAIAYHNKLHGIEDTSCPTAS